MEVWPTRKHKKNEKLKFSCPLNGGRMTVSSAMSSLMTIYELMQNYHYLSMHKVHVSIIYNKVYARSGELQFMLLKKAVRYESIHIFVIL